MKRLLIGAVVVGMTLKSFALLDPPSVGGGLTAGGINGIITNSGIFVNYITNTQQGVTLKGLTIAPSANIGNYANFGINDTGGTLGIDTFGNNVRFKIPAGGSFYFMESILGNQYLQIMPSGDLNMLMIPSNQMLGDTVGLNSLNHYPAGVAGQMNVPQYTGGGSGLGELPDPTGVANAMPIPPWSFVTFYVYSTNITENVLTNLAYMASTNGMMTHMTNIGIPITIQSDIGWQQKGRDANGKLQVTGGFSDSMKYVAGIVHSFGEKLRLTIYYDNKIPALNNTLHVGANGGPTITSPLQSDVGLAGLPIVDCSSPMTVAKDVEWFYTNGVDQVRIADCGVLFNYGAAMIQMREQWHYYAQHPTGVDWRVLQNRASSNALTFEYLGTEINVPSAALALGNMQGTDVIALGTNIASDVIGWLQRYDNAQWNSFGFGHVPDLSFSSQAHLINSNGFRLFISLAATIPCAPIMTTEVLTNSMQVMMTNDSVNGDFAASSSMKSIGSCVFTNAGGDFFTYGRTLNNGDVVAAVVNKSTTAGTQVITFTQLGLAANVYYLVKDDWGQTNLGTFIGSFTTPTVLNGGGNLYHISAALSGGGKPTAVTVGGSPFTFASTVGVPIECYIDDGAALFSVTKNGVAIRSSLAGSYYFVLQPSNSIVLTYPVTAPTFNTNAL